MGSVNHAVLDFEHSAVIQAAKFFKVGQILRATRCLLRFDESVLGQIRHWNVPKVHNYPLGPAFIELKAGDSREEVELTRGHADGELEALLGKIRLSDFDQRDTELDKRSSNPRGVLGRWLDPKIEVLGKAGLRMVRYRVATYDEVTNFMNAEQP